MLSKQDKFNKTKATFMLQCRLGRIIKKGVFGAKADPWVFFSVYVYGGKDKNTGKAYYDTFACMASFDHAKTIELVAEKQYLVLTGTLQNRYNEKQQRAEIKFLVESVLVGEEAIHSNDAQYSRYIEEQKDKAKAEFKNEDLF